MDEAENTNQKIGLKEIKEILEETIINDLKLELEEIKKNTEELSEEEFKQQQETALIKMAAFKKNNHIIGFDKLVMILDDVVTRAGYGHIKSLIIDRYAYER